MKDKYKSLYEVTGRIEDVATFLVPISDLPPQRKPQFKEFIKWVEDQGHDAAHTYNPNTGKWICLNSMTADLWKAWEAAHGIKE